MARNVVRELLARFVHLRRTTPCIQMWGANTDVGKTLMSVGLVGEVLRRAGGRGRSNRDNGDNGDNGHRALYLKPMQTGYPVDSDARKVRTRLPEFPAGAPIDGRRDCWSKRSWVQPQRGVRCHMLYAICTVSRSTHRNHSPSPAEYLSMQGARVQSRAGDGERKDAVHLRAAGVAPPVRGPADGRGARSGRAGDHGQYNGGSPRCEKWARAPRGRGDVRGPGVADAISYDAGGCPSAPVPPRDAGRGRKAGGHLDDAVLVRDDQEPRLPGPRRVHAARRTPPESRSGPAPRGRGSDRAGSPRGRRAAPGGVSGPGGVARPVRRVLWT